MITKNLGGDRLGSGNKMNVSMRGYERSTHDLSRVWRSTMACGTLVPFLNEISLPGDTWDIDLNTMVRTQPTTAPLFGSFKLQLDVFSVPIRLFSAGLHMNLLKVGLNMKDIKLPLMNINGSSGMTFNQSTILSYLGVRGLPSFENGVSAALVPKNALSLLSYWNIYKNYYANKQEENAYYITQGIANKFEITKLEYKQSGFSPINLPFDLEGVIDPEMTGTSGIESLFITHTGDFPYGKVSLKLEYNDNGETVIIWDNLDNLGSLVKISDTQMRFDIDRKYEAYLKIIQIMPIKDDISTTTLGLQAFPLKNIDDIQLDILKKDIGSPYFIDATSKKPYSDCVGFMSGVGYKNQFSQNGLAIKTYQSDIYNNWLSTEFIDGSNGINSITAIDTSSGKFTLDTLNLAKKVYDMLNRVAVSGGSYEDWIEAIWGEDTFRKAESPIYLGGLSSEIVFDEVVSTAESTNQDGPVPLGSLAGRGTQSNKRKGGKVVVRTTEPSIIMGIVSITPRVDYSQGNKWFTNLRTMDDFHKPGLDGIGFQELITETMAHWDSTYDDITDTFKHKSAGKQPAWLNYMTAVNETYGHFAESPDNPDTLMQMTLNRQYVKSDFNNIEDLTTYIDPTKFNYAFAQGELDAQNFWVQIATDIIARRKMSAKIIPNL